MNRRCQDCVFFHQDGATDGLCRRYAPQIASRKPLDRRGDRIFAVWPSVDIEDWCGEWLKGKQ